MSKKTFKNNLCYSTDFNMLKSDVNSKTTDYTQKVFIALNKSKNSKLVTSVSNIDCSNEELIKIAKIIKEKCGTGGTVKDGEILIQGNFTEKIYNIIKSLGFDNIKK